MVKKRQPIDKATYPERRLRRVLYCKMCYSEHTLISLLKQAEYREAFKKITGIEIRKS